MEPKRGLSVFALIYSGLALNGLSLGAVIGFWFSGGRSEFKYGGWADTLSAAIAGALIGVGLAQLCVAWIRLRREK